MRIQRRAASLLLGLAAAAALSLATPQAARASGEDYRSDRAGHPVRVAAYLLHPPFVILDYVIMRPAYWIGGFQPFRTLFGVKRSPRDPAETGEAQPE